jgi:N-acylneuraminate cytidylyltransferase/CMP-N,N'-diacetyllegionaminic acid synthase
MVKGNKILAYIPARAGSKRVLGKNIKKFLGKPLIAHAIEQALDCPIIDRVIVDTDSEKTAKIARRYGAEVPFLRPSELAQDNSKTIDAILYMLNRLEKEQKYTPTHLLILQTTSPLREIQDILDCWKLMQTTNATTVVTVCRTHPALFYMNDKCDIKLVNGREGMSTNTQAWPKAYVLNGCFVYLVDIPTMRKENKIITKKTKAVVCPKWRSVDVDTPEEWVMTEVLCKNKKYIYERLKRF